MMLRALPSFAGRGPSDLTVSSLAADMATTQEMFMSDLEDKQKITEAIYLYCRGLDRGDLSVLEKVYHPDATEDRGEGLFVGNAWDMLEQALKVLDRVYASTQHFMGNILIEVSGDTAFAESYFQAYHRRKDFPEPSSSKPTKEFVMSGRYLDRFEKRNGNWKIAHRKMIVDWVHSRNVDETWFERNPGAIRGGRNGPGSRLQDM